MAKDISTLIQKGDLKNAESYFKAATERYGRSSLLANAQLKLNDAFDARAPKIEIIKLSAAPLKNLISKSAVNNNAALKLKHTLYIGFNFINFSPKATWLDVNLIDSQRKIKIAQKPIVISQQFGEHFFDISLEQAEFYSGNYKVELKLNNRILKSEVFTVQK